MGEAAGSVEHPAGESGGDSEGKDRRQSYGAKVGSSTGTEDGEGEGEEGPDVGGIAELGAEAKGGEEPAGLVRVLGEEAPEGQEGD